MAEVRLINIKRMRLNRRWQRFLPFAAILVWCLVTGLTARAVAYPSGAAYFDVPLEILAAGISSAEDDPFVAESYRFMPGDFLYFVFEVGGYHLEKKQKEKEKDKEKDKDEGSGQLHLSYEVELIDAAGVPLTAPEKGVIEDETSSKDKDWLPKRRVSLQLPPLLVAGRFTLRVTVNDSMSKAVATRDFPFQTGGHQLTLGQGLSVQHFTFYRTEQQEDPLEVAAYRAGDTVWARFDITGFKTGPGNRYQLEYAVAALKPDGSVLFKQEKAAELAAESFYPAQFVPGVLSLTTTGELVHTQYTIVVTVRDLVGKQTVESRQTFRIE